MDGKPGTGVDDPQNKPRIRRASVCWQMTAQEARQIIEAFASGARTYEVAETVLRQLSGASLSVHFSCSGNREFVAKGTRNGRGLVAEHVVARLGQLLEAPVGEVTLLEIPPALQTHPAVSQMGLGTAHATRFIAHITERAGLTYHNVPDNRSRFARLCVLYSLTVAQDHQLFYGTAAPNLVYSLDHGHFFPSGPAWTAASVNGAPQARVDAWFAAAALTNAELADARTRLEGITDVDIANILAGPPPDWPFIAEERSALGNFLKTRRDTLLNLLPQA
jgi:hypothetical protein